MTSARLRQLMVVMLACGAYLGLLPTPAHACSCAGQGPAEMLASHDGAFIGELVSRRGGLLAGNATWTFEVTQEVKGSFGRTVRITSPSSGAACGFELDAGQEAAIFVRIDGQRLHSGLCSTLQADTLRAHLNPKRAVDTRATLLVGSSGTGRHLWLFDDHGRLANASDDGRGEWLQDLALCPGGRTLAELWDGEVVVRDLRTLEAVRTQRVPRNVGRVWCQGARGDDLLGARRDRETGDWDSIVALQAPRRPLISGDWIDVEIVDDHLLAAVGREYTQLRRISLASGRQTLLHTARDRAGVATDIAAAIEGFAVSPDGTRVAFEITTYPAAGSPSSDLFVYELSTGRRRATRHIPAEGMQVHWVDDRSLMFTTYEQGPQVLDASNLHPLAILPEGAHWAQVRGSDDTLLGMDGPRLGSVDLRTGRVRTLATIPNEHGQWVMRLPRPLKAHPGVEQREPEPPVTRPGEDTASPTQVGTGSWSLLGSAALLAAVAALIVAGFVVLRVRRRRG